MISYLSYLYLISQLIQNSVRKRRGNFILKTGNCQNKAGFEKKQEEKSNLKLSVKEKVVSVLHAAMQFTQEGNRCRGGVGGLLHAAFFAELQVSWSSEHGDSSES